ncbi:MAG: twin-arginine translocation signal domain-containing protein [Planctomycetaceae bacterium]|jgi:hypothetical protein|nr:twin-arginine translocation signal domain-containing protein [Planctomycetaceae bacterium]
MKTPTRRDFLKTSAIGGVTVSACISVARLVHAQESGTIKIGFWLVAAAP